jgi:hypothetical protein
MKTTVEQEYRAWRRTRPSEVVMERYTRLAMAVAERGRVVDMKRLALGGVRWELTTNGDPDLGAPKYLVYDAFLEWIRLDLLHERPALEPFLRPPVRRPGGRNARHSGAIRRPGRE